MNFKYQQSVRHFILNILFIILTITISPTIASKKYSLEARNAFVITSRSNKVDDREILDGSSKNRLHSFLLQYDGNCSIKSEAEFYHEFKSINSSNFTAFITKYEAKYTPSVICNHFKHLKCARFYDLAAKPRPKSFVERCVCKPPTYYWKKQKKCVLGLNETCTHKELHVNSSVTTQFKNLNQNLPCGFDTYCARARCICSPLVCPTYDETGEYNYKIDEKPDTLHVQQFVNEMIQKHRKQKTSNSNPNNKHKQTMLTHGDCCNIEATNFWFWQVDPDDDERDYVDEDGSIFEDDTFGVDLKTVYEVEMLEDNNLRYSHGLKVKVDQLQFCNVFENLECKSTRTCDCLDGHSRQHKEVSKNGVSIGESGNTCEPVVGEVCSRMYKYKGTWHPANVSDVKCAQDGLNISCVLANDKINFVCCPDIRDSNMSRMLRHQPLRFPRCPRPPPRPKESKTSIILVNTVIPYTIIAVIFVNVYLY